MPKVLKFAALYPKHLNLNGDHANLLVLQKRLEWRGVEAQIFPLEKPTNLEDFELVLLGHGSSAAWSQVLKLDPELISNLVERVNSNHQVLAIGSGYAKLMEALVQESTAVIEQRSEFIDVKGIVGYVNSDLNLPEVSWFKNSMLTLLHGPVLAKNPQLADEIIDKANWCDLSINSERLVAVDEFAKASRRIAFED